MNSQNFSTTDRAGWFTGHSDGGSRGNPGPAGFGAVIEGPDGQTVAQLSHYLGITTNNVAEYSGLLSILEWAIGNRIQHLRVISDSLLMVNQINGAWKVKNPQIKVLCARALDMIKQIEKFEITHTLREGNKTADMLANQAMDRGQKSPSTEPVWTPSDSLPNCSANEAVRSATVQPVLLYYGVNDQHEFWQSADQSLIIMQVHGEAGWTSHRNFMHVDGGKTAQAAAATLNATLSDDLVWQRKGNKFTLVSQSTLPLQFAG